MYTSKGTLFLPKCPKITIILCPFLNQDKAFKWISHLQTLPQDPGHIQTQCSPLISLNVKLHTSFKQQLKMLNKYWLMIQSRVCTNLQVERLVTVRPQLCLFTKEWTNCLQIFLMFNMYNNSYYSQFVTMHHDFDFPLCHLMLFVLLQK